MTRRMLLLAALWGCVRLGNTAPACAGISRWNLWRQFNQQMISPEGRVIDRADPRQITTSEGQSYALFFALVDNDPITFQRLLSWTERHLAHGDLTARLPAWLWGQDGDGAWKVLDANTASDSDLWLAYTLLQAGRLWKRHSYTALGTLLLQRIAREEVVDLPGFGYLLLPGKQGFMHDQHVRFNPSYLPPQLVDGIYDALQTEPWVSLVGNTRKFLMQTSPRGAAPDWVHWSGQGWLAADGSAIGSYDAIRVYLWVGMLHPQASGASSLKKHFQQIASYLKPGGLPPAKIDTANGDTFSSGPVGFSAALLPLLADTPAETLQLRRLRQESWREPSYYNSVLTLFGQGWYQQRYRFDVKGHLLPAWTLCQ